MTSARRRGFWAAAVGLAALAAACQPLPHPFADDRPPAALLAVPDSIDIAVGAIEGEPHAAAVALGSAIAGELIKRNIPASEKTVGRSSYRLDGRIEETPAPAGKAVVTVFWRLRAPTGRIVAERSDRQIAATREWEAGRTDGIAKLAAAGADGFAALLSSAPPKEEPGGGRVRIAIRKINGAPGDGNESLSSALGMVLKRHDLDIVDSATGKPDLAVDAQVTIDPAKADKQHVKIVWRLSRAAGPEIGTVAQENDVPKGRLDGPWGDVAYSVAIAAEGGIMQLVDRGAPTLKIGATVGVPPPARSPEPGPGEAPPPVATSPPAPGNIASPAVVLPPVTVNSIGPPDAAVILPKRGVPIPHD